jgi:hypothetical protein
MGTIADIYGKAGYAAGFSVFVVLAILSIIVVYGLLRKSRKNDNAS